MWLIVGLGNPGSEYEWTRHNLGFMVIDSLARESGIQVKTRQCQALVGKGNWEDREIVLVKPQTYMNLSGEAVSCLIAKHRIEAPGENLIVISDDLALPFGKIRIRARGSAGGHNGLKSITASLGTDEYIRLRIGIQPDHPLSDTKRYVLSPFPMAQREEVEQIVKHSAEAVHAILNDGVLKAMAKHN
ncbi:MAG TPA: aminoacyl-tRNA hydrolase [Pyrinomonadaceae bacterium]|jgi:PTH1 family peptidyl-tRNA hydrolase